jgi:hypothetical protein
MDQLDDHLLNDSPLDQYSTKTLTSSTRHPLEAGSHNKRGFALFLPASQAREKQMEHNHGNEYQVKTVRRDGTEELSGWMNNREQVAQAMVAARRPQDKAYWLLERNVLCPNCLDREQIILEYPLTDIPSPRFSPHDSRYLRAVG